MLCHITVMFSISVLSISVLYIFEKGILKQNRIYKNTSLDHTSKITPFRKKLITPQNLE